MLKRKSSDGQEKLPMPFKMQLTVIRNRKSKCVVYLECGKELVNILLDVLMKPLQELLKLLGDADLLQGMKNGLFTLYAGVSTMETSTLLVAKEVLLAPSDVSFHNCFLVQQTKCYRSGCPNFASKDSFWCKDCQVVKRYSCLNCEEKGISPGGSTTCSSCSESFKKSQKFEYKLEAKSQRSSTGSSYCKSGPYRTTGDFAMESITYMVREDLSISKSGALNSLVLQQLENFGELEARKISVGEKEVCNAESLPVATRSLSIWRLIS